ncbi:MAG: serine protease, partial [Prevotella sp.]|nr:serine protease [Prevotella sp.]
LSQNDPTMRQSQIRIAIPDDLQQAQLALMLARERGEADYESTINDFIQQFPSSTDGYYAKALLKANQKDYSAAENSMQQALQKASSKEEAHYNYARLALSISEQEETIEEKSKQTDKALEQIHKAYRLSPQPQYQQLEAQILFVKGGYQQAYELFIALTKSPIRNGELFYEAALAREQLNGTNEEIYALLDSAVCACDTPYTAIAAPYILARALQRDKMADYRNAMLDFFRYEALMYGRLSADFYFMRGQSEMRGKIFQPALNDLAHAVMLDPNNTLYWAELASANLRVGQRKEAIMAAQHCLDLDSEQADALLILGISQAEDGEKKEGLKNIQRAKELGNEQADKFLNKFK